MNYGLPYKGSKSRICKWLMAHLPPADTFIDLFAGGCAVTHAAMLSGKYNHVIANDVQADVLELFHRVVTQGLSPEDWRPVSRQEFFLHAPTNPLVRLVWSFGNNCKSYLYAQDIEEQKLLAHSMIVSETIRDRYTAFQSFCSTLKNSQEAYRDLPSFSRLARIQALHSLARIQALHGLARIQALLRISVGSYDMCPYLPPVIFSGLRRSTVHRHFGVHLRRIQPRPFLQLAPLCPVPGLRFGVPHAGRFYPDCGNKTPVHSERDRKQHCDRATLSASALRSSGHSGRPPRLVQWRSRNPPGTTSPHG